MMAANWCGGAEVLLEKNEPIPPSRAGVPEA